MIGWIRWRLRRCGCGCLAVNEAEVKRLGRRMLGLMTSDPKNVVVPGGSGGSGGAGGSAVDPAVARLIDANANRAREGLRVMEDLARFVLGAGSMAGEIKQLRHDLRTVVATIGVDAEALLAARDTVGDVGAANKTVAEGERGAASEVAAAACKRVGEALRVLEECAKLTSEGAWRGFERLRYGAYGAEQKLMLALMGGRASQWAVCVLITEALCSRPWLDVARAAVTGGAEAIQLREKGLPDHELLVRARALVAVCRPAGVAVIVNDRPDIALLAGADGVHLGQEDLALAEVRKLAGGRLLVGLSTHNEAEAQAAIEAGADYCGVGAMFATTTKVRDVSGAGYLRSYLSHEVWGRTPHLAIGGIGPENVQKLVNAGARGIAVSGCVCRAADPQSVTAELVMAVKRGPV